MGGFCGAGCEPRAVKRGLVAALQVMQLPSARLATFSRASGFEEGCQARGARRFVGATSMRSSQSVGPATTLPGAMRDASYSWHCMQGAHAVSGAGGARHLSRGFDWAYPPSCRDSVQLLTRSCPPTHPVTPHHHPH